MQNRIAHGIGVLGAIQRHDQVPSMSSADRPALHQHGAAVPFVAGVGGGVVLAHRGGGQGLGKRAEGTIGRATDEGRRTAQETRQHVTISVWCARIEGGWRSWRWVGREGRE